ncbi:MAG: DUF3473 domain-containing protein [Planctomycetota bacterium]|nr:DUF3473 domain-containing protein [Planctomycetota bacterium]
MSRERPIQNAMTVDVEDYFQVSAFESVVDRGDWGAYELRVEASTRRLLDLFDAQGVKATFFTLGWVAERCPELVRDIHAGGHELASHGYAHRLVSDLTPEAFREDLQRAKEALEAAAPGAVIDGFRAPSFSITKDTLWAYDVMREEGYRYSSSVFPVRHDRYGMPRFPRRPVRLTDYAGRSMWEVPMTTWRVLGRNLPVAGGGWMRVLPPAVMRRGIRAANAEGTAAIIYLHPWEVDPEQPRVQAASRASRARHYVNLDKTYDRVRGLLEAFPFGTIRDVLDREAETRRDTTPALAPTALTELVTP